MPRRLDIAVAGCGIGGMAVAALLAREGHRVRLFDQFDRPAPVGSGLLLQPSGMAVLDRLDLRQRIEGTGAKVDRLHGLSGDRLVLAVQYDRLRRPDPWATGIHRAALFDALFDVAVEAAVEIFPGHRVIAVERVGRAGRLVFADNVWEGPFDLIIDATGSRSPLVDQPARHLTFGALWITVADRGGAALPATLTQRYRAARQMAGLLPVGSVAGREEQCVALFWSIRADDVAQWRHDGIGAWRRQWSHLWPEAAGYADDVASCDDFDFARYHHRTLRRPVNPPVVHIGDAWHSTSPQLGQGANMALLDAWALAQAIAGEADVAAALKRFVALRRWHVRLYQLFSLALTPLYQSDRRLPAFLRDWLVAPALRMPLLDPVQSAAVAGLIGLRMKRLGLYAEAPSLAIAGDARHRTGIVTGERPT